MTAGKADAEVPPWGIERIALLATGIALGALAVIRVDMTDTPWHLTTARYAWTHGTWPSRNTFSFTHPEYPLFQQYPIYQSILYGVHQLAGFAGLSLLHAMGWLTVWLLGMRWAYGRLGGGGWRRAALMNLAWMLALLGLQRRMVLRPDLLTFVWFGLLLNVVQAYLSGRRAWAVGLVVIQWCMANTHQLFLLGLAVQGALVAHLVLVRFAAGRWGVATGDRAVALLPAALALAASCLACLGTPLGLAIVQAPAHTAGSLSHHREHVQEFAPITSTPISLTLVIIAAGVAVAGFWRGRRSWSPFDIGVWLVTLAMVAGAERGTAFFVLTSVAVFARCGGCCHAGSAVRMAPGRRAEAAPGSSWGRLLATATTLALCVVIVTYRWVIPARQLGGPQPGVGKSLGSWADAGVEFLRKHRPPGRPYNTWYAGNALLWGLYPDLEVFVDPRFETYPRAFLLDAITAETDAEVFDRLVHEHQLTWGVFETRVAGGRQQVARLVCTGAWRLVYADTVFLVVVRVTPETEAYLRHHGADPLVGEPKDLLSEPSDLRGLQWIRWSALLADLGHTDAAARVLAQARELAEKHANVRRALIRYEAEGTTP